MKKTITYTNREICQALVDYEINRRLDLSLQKGVSVSVGVDISEDQQDFTLSATFEDPPKDTKEK